MSLPIYQRVAVTDAGDVIPGAEYTVINENTGVAAPIYSDRTGATLLSAPYFADSAGTIQFFIAQGTTFRVAASGGVGTYTDRYVYGVAEAVLVQANGNVGIGNSDPAVPLDVRKAGGGNFIANFQNTTAGTPYGVSIKDAVGGASGYPLFQVTNSAGSVAHLKVMSGTGDVIVGSGVYLGGTGAANKLDDYEEGTWTPSQIGLGAVGNVISAYYRKVGDLVFFTVDITAAITSNTGPFQLVLPFTPVGFSTIQLTATSLAYTTSSATVAEVQGGSGLMFRTSHNGGTMTNAALSNARIIASGSYIPI